MATTRVSGIRLAKRLDEVGFSDIVQIRNKVMAMRAEGLSGALAVTAVSRFFETPDDIKFARGEGYWWRIRRTTLPPPACCRFARPWFEKLAP